jgi:hypothetical protein
MRADEQERQRNRNGGAGGGGRAAQVAEAQQQRRGDERRAGAEAERIGDGAQNEAIEARGAGRGRRLRGRERGGDD